MSWNTGGSYTYAMDSPPKFLSNPRKSSCFVGTPINKAPSLGGRDLNLYRLFKVVQNLGGYNRVTNQVKWRQVYSRMGLPPTNTAANQIKAAYKK